MGGSEITKVQTGKVRNILNTSLWRSCVITLMMLKPDGRSFYSTVMTVQAILVREDLQAGLAQLGPVFTSGPPHNVHDEMMGIVRV